MAAAIPATAQDSSRTKQLNLTSEQQTKLKDINQSFFKDAQQVRKDTTLSPADKKSKMQALSNAREAKVKSVLTPDQTAKWQQQHTAMKHKMADMHQKNMHRSDSTRGKKALASLKLSDDQTAKMQAIHKDFKSKVKAIRQDSTAAKQDQLAKLKALHQEKDAQVKSVLSADQYQQYQAMANEKGKHHKHGHHKGAKKDFNKDDKAADSTAK
ncbi:hypothetical protein SAMN05444266_106241 [Chitinophaga jiangningensis]|uniref:LTXXQ motif family protein n=2 Tax=Chitinophaga jiangningensis TaxID=1419482 RepID=A0A1M7FQS4_9BACT|nr:hypothetical protein SAMN05444266_106241 [Chitinophaga jiangningensis]